MLSAAKMRIIKENVYGECFTYIWRLLNRTFSCIRNPIWQKPKSVSLEPNPVRKKVKLVILEPNPDRQKPKPFSHIRT